MTEGENWRAESIARAKKALSEAESSADRLALLRELTRLEHGRLSLAAIGISLSQAERSLLVRFGLIEASDGSALLMDSSKRQLWSEVLALDTRSRRLHTPTVADAVLLRFSAHTAYQNDTQKAALRAMITMPPAATLVVSMPTGSGKSLLFQIAPKWWKETAAVPTVVVIVPTTGLAMDHERTLSKIAGLEKSRALSSQLSLEERAEILRSFRRGEVPVLLLSPEMALGSARDSLIEAAHPPEEKLQGLQAQLTALFVDEAHIIQSWGASFRPEFQRLPALVDALRTRNSDLRTILLSATLNRVAREELRRSYRGGHFLDINAGVPRHELDLVTHSVSTADERNRIILTAVDQFPRPAIVYTTRVSDAHELYDRLRRDPGYRRLRLFTGEEDQVERKRIVEAWAQDKIDLVVGTSAFGMGIDKPNVRAILHACLPEGPARYYQEIGRAARDGHQGVALTVWVHSRGGSYNDEQVAFGFAASRWLTEEKAALRWSAIVRRLSGQKGVLWDENTQTRVLRIPLDAAHEGISSTPNEKNRLWNMSLLNLMQRAGAITIRTQQESAGAPIWEAAVEWPALLGEDDKAREAWNKIFKIRDEERRNAVADLIAFRDLMTGHHERCLLSGVFELIEPEGSFAMPCGRCPTCRARGIDPPSEIRFGGLDQVWPTEPTWSHSHLPVGTTFLHPDDPEFTIGLPALLARLVSVGIEQLVVPDGFGAEVAQLLCRTRVRAGFVLEWRDMLSEAALWNLPTAVLLHTKARIKPIFYKLTDWIRTYPAQSLALVAGSGCTLDGRPLEQVACKTAPYYEEYLDRIVRYAGIV